MRSRHNDEERREWVQNDEGLWCEYRASRQSMRAFIRANRALIDTVIEQVTTGRKPAHYLRYGG